MTEKIARWPTRRAVIAMKHSNTTIGKIRGNIRSGKSMVLRDRRSLLLRTLKSSEAGTIIITYTKAAENPSLSLIKRDNQTKIDQRKVGSLEIFPPKLITKECTQMAIIIVISE